MKHTFAYLIILITFSVVSYGQESIQWNNWQVGMVKAEAENKKVVVHLYTDWCTWCKKMDQTTFQDSLVIKYMNENFVAIKFDAEQRDDIIFKGETYKFTRGGLRGYHALASKLTHGQLKYPTTVFMDEDSKVIQMLPGFKNSLNLETILTYFAGDHHKNTPWAIFQINYESVRDTEPNSFKKTQLVSGKGF
jgi:thioredoxin-related protein